MVERCVMNWNQTFLEHIDKFVQGIIDKGLQCVVVGRQQHHDGLAVLLAISNGDEYKEHYQLAYSGSEIIGESVNVR